MLRPRTAWLVPGFLAVAAAASVARPDDGPDGGFSPSGRDVAILQDEGMPAPARRRAPARGDRASIPRARPGGEGPAAADRRAAFGGEAVAGRRVGGWLLGLGA